VEAPYLGLYFSNFALLMQTKPLLNANPDCTLHYAVERSSVLPRGPLAKVCYASIATKFRSALKWTRCAKSGCEQSQQRASPFDEIVGKGNPTIISLH
jgi:hypothetical protein